jgi:hypothetical protein
VTPFRAALALCLLLLAAAPAASQTVRVTVSDAATGAPVAGAMVRVEDATGALAQAGFADARGQVELRLEEGGRYSVGASRSGYRPVAEAVSVAPGAPTAVTLRLASRPLLLDTVTVVGAAEREVGKETFERRRLTAGGIYLDSAYVARRRATYPGDLLYSIPGIDVVAERRSGVRRPVTRMGSRCLAYLVNGLPFYGGWPRFVPLEQTLRRTDVVAVEVYREYTEVPRELRPWIRSQCGVIVYWTEDGWFSTSRGAAPDAGG